MEAGVEPRGLWPDSDGEVWALMSGHKDMGAEIHRHTHVADVQTGPIQPCTHPGTDEGLEAHSDTRTHMWT